MPYSSDGPTTDLEMQTSTPATNDKNLTITVTTTVTPTSPATTVEKSDMKYTTAQSKGRVKTQGSPNDPTRYTLKYFADVVPEPYSYSNGHPLG
jgi:hypothetical protein